MVSDVMESFDRQALNLIDGRCGWMSRRSTENMYEDMYEGSDRFVFELI